MTHRHVGLGFSLAGWLVASCAGLAISELTHGAVSAAEEKLPAKQVEFFESKIRPVLVTHCYKCHSAESEGGKPKAGLLLDSKEGTLAGGESGAAVIPKDIGGSLLIDALKHMGGLSMPPGKKLPDNVIADFEQWVKMGAPDPRVGGQAIVKKTIDIEEGRKFWAFQPPQKVAAPKVKNAKWAQSDIDRFLLAELETRGLTPVADADKRVLIRRLYFDIIGLPPTPDEIDAFLKDTSKTAVENVVDRLLASPHFGERWGRHWLDVARYAESNGNADNVVFAHAWRYRDYVIAAFNADKPFNRFVLEQVAGDLLPTEKPDERNAHLIATGFLALGSKPRAQNNPNFQMDIVAEQIEVVTTGFMGLTVACARCHDHKFDPIPTKEYYSLAGIFSSTNTLFGTGVRGNNGAKTDVGGGYVKLSTTNDSAKTEHKARLETLRKIQDRLMTQIKDLGGTIEAVKPEPINRKNLTKQQKQNLKKNPAAAQPSGEPRFEVKAPESLAEGKKDRFDKIAKQFGQITGEIKDLAANPPGDNELAMGVCESNKVGDCAICVRGESNDRGDVVQRGLISVVTKEAPEIPSKQSGRLQLAEWIASPQNPLTSRVIVNRAWKHLFGRGLVPSVDNFGGLGEKPSHPELLDHLALKFVEEGWSVKKLVRTLVLTRAYGLSSDHSDVSYTKDPDNVYNWRHTPHRVDAETLRDSLLFVSGKLETTPATGSALSKFGGQDLRRAQLDADSLMRAEHRSVYLPIIRNRLPEVLDLFDVADPSLVVGSRDTTTVPSQSLYFMNSPFVITQAKAFAKRLLSQEGLDDAQRLTQAYRLAFGREPSATERERTLQLLGDAKAAHETGKAKADSEALAWTAVTQALLSSAEFRYVE